MLFSLALASISTTMSFDWGAIMTALAPTIAVVVTWYLQRRSTQHEAAKVAGVATAAADRVAEIHKVDNEKVQEAVGAVHTLVNGQREALVAENKALRSQLDALKK